MTNKLYIIGTFAVVLLFTQLIFQPFKPKNEKVISVQNQQQIIPTPILKTTLPSGGQKIEVFAFHSTQRCISCVNVSQFVKETIDEKFSDEVSLGKIIFREINIDLADNRQLAKDYEVSGSSLYITVTKDGQTFKEEDADVWRYVPYETKFKSYFESKLKALL